jgi:hypothetical protein
MSEHERKRILSLDGGGTWALIQIEALIDLYGSDARGHAILGHFDLAVATSGGALVLGGLAADLSLATLYDLFMDAPKIAGLFGKKRGAWWRTKLGISPRYTTTSKRAALDGLYGPLGSMRIHELGEQLGTQLVFVTYDYDARRSIFVRSKLDAPSASRSPPGDDPSESIRELSLVDAVHGSSTPPVRFFDEPALTDAVRTRRLWDGGVGGYDNPAVVGVAELLAQGVDPHAIALLSIGTGQVRLLPDRSAALLRARGVELPQAAIEPGGDPLRMRLAKRTHHELELLAMACLDDPPDAATYVAYLMLGHRPPLDDAREPPDLRLVRMNPVLGPVRVGARWQLPSGFADPSRFAQLAALDIDAHAQHEIGLIRAFAQAWRTAHTADALPNQGIRQCWDGSLDLGHATFSAAKQRWSMLAQLAGPRP